MSHVNVLTANVREGTKGKKVLEVEATLTYQLTEPYQRINVVYVKSETDLPLPFKQSDIISLGEFNEKLYGFRQTYEESYDRFPSSTVNTNMESVVEETD